MTGPSQSRRGGNSFQLQGTTGKGAKHQHLSREGFFLLLLYFVQDGLIGLFERLGNGTESLLYLVICSTILETLELKIGPPKAPVVKGQLASL